jgi:hypothetical protein
MSIDYEFAVAEPKEIGGRAIFIFLVGEVFRNSWTGVFDNMRAAGDGCRGVTTGGMNTGGADDQTHSLKQCPFGREYINRGSARPRRKMPECGSSFFPRFWLFFC